MPRIRRRIEHVFEDVTTWQAEISAALAAPTGLDDPSRIDAIRSLEQLVCAATAAQAALAAELDRPRRTDQAALGVPAAQHGRGVAAQVALARRERTTAANGTSVSRRSWPASCRTPGGRGEPGGSRSGRPRRSLARPRAVPRRPRGGGRDRRGRPPPSRADGRSRARPRLPAGGLPARPRVVRLPSPPGGGRPSRLAPASARRDDVAERAAAGEGRRRSEGGAEPHGGECPVRGRPDGPGPSSRPTRWSTPCSRELCEREPARSSSAWS